MYFYHGYALGVASTIPDKEFTEASSALSPSGGKASAHVRNFDRNGILFKSAESEVVGAWESRRGLSVWTTAASVIIQDLNILGMLTAGRTEAHIYSEFGAGHDEASIVVTGSNFEDLKIAGKPAHLEISEDLSARYPTYRSMEIAYENNFSRDTVLESIEGRGLNPEDLTTLDLLNTYEGYQQQKALTSLKSTIVCSFVKKIAIQDGGNIKTWGPIIAVPNFGNIYLGEIVVWPWMRCLNMFRVELTPSNISSGGCISGGSAGVGGMALAGPTNPGEGRPPKGRPIQGGR